MDKDLESIQEARSLLQAAHDAWLKFENFTEEQVERVLLEISKAGIANAEPLARLAVEETGYGNVEHKTLKNLFCADDVYRAIRPMKTVGIVSEDKEKKVFEVASPIGVIAAIIPSTNPTSTAIYKALIALKGRNAIVFSPHPSAAKCIGETSRLIAEAAEQAGAPKGVISCMKVPTKEGTHICSYQEKAQLERTIQTPRRTLNTKIVGKAAAKIAEMAGFSVSAGTRALVAHADGVGPEYPISMEKLSPILAFYVVKDWKEGCAKCIEILNFGGLGHTLSLHTRDEEVVRQFALYKPAFRICVNTPAALGAVGYTTNLFPSMTLGCGAAGGNITSDNISPLHLINLKRVAYGVRDVAAPPPRTLSVVASTNSPTPARATIEQVVDQWLGRRPSVTPPAPASVPAPVAPPLSSYKELEPPRPKPEKKESKPVGFVCEDDV